MIHHRFKYSERLFESQRVFFLELIMQNFKLEKSVNTFKHIFLKFHLTISSTIKNTFHNKIKQ